MNRQKTTTTKPIRADVLNLGGVLYNGNPHNGHVLVWFSLRSKRFSSLLVTAFLLSPDPHWQLSCISMEDVTAIKGERNHLTHISH
jgi:hypothetical protein